MRVTIIYLVLLSTAASELAEFSLSLTDCMPTIPMIKNTRSLSLLANKAIGGPNNATYDKWSGALELLSI